MAQVDYTKKDTCSNPLYRAWHNMSMRCLNPNVPCYKNYGGRGIKVCSRWRTFDNFYQDLSKSYKPGLQLDRIDNDGNYEPKNCQWVTLKQNTRHTRRTRYITYLGETKSVTEWAEALGIKSSTFRQRFYVYDWSLDRLIGGYLVSS